MTKSNKEQEGREELDFEPDRLIRMMFLRNRAVHKGAIICL